jgi:hypothetical protein
MGPGRAGAYTYDWIENLLSLNMHSADAIIPSLQHIAVGDAWQLGSKGSVLRVARLEPERALGLRSDDGNGVWASFSTRLMGQRAWSAATGSPLRVRPGWHGQ